MSITTVPRCECRECQQARAWALQYFAQPAPEPDGWWEDGYDPLPTEAPRT